MYVCMYCNSLAMTTQGVETCSHVTLLKCNK